MMLKNVWSLVKEAVNQWLEHDPFTQGAALAYYALFSLAPIVMIALTVAGFLFGERAARGELSRKLSQQTSPQVAQSVEQMIGHSYQSGSGPLATTIGMVVLLIGATGLFAQLQSALNRVWEVKPKPGRGLRYMLQGRLWSFVAVLGIGALLIASLVGSSVLMTFASFVGPAALPGGLSLWRLAGEAISLILLTLLVAMLYKILPDVQIPWADVCVGATVTAVLFTLGKYVISLYLGWSSIASPFGAASSIVVILLWVYYSSLIVLLGAEFSHVYARRSGQRTIHSENVVPDHSQ